MGNRAIITFEENSNRHPVALYVHWNGGLESVLAFVTYTFDKFGGHDLYDYHARLCQVIGNFFSDGYSLYCHPASAAAKSASGCDNGHFHFRYDRKEGLNLIAHNSTKDQSLMDRLVQRAKAHDYWQGDKTIFHSIDAAQPAPSRAERMLEALKSAEQFISGFENDPVQENIDTALLPLIREAIEASEGRAAS